MISFLFVDFSSASPLIVHIKYLELNNLFCNCLRFFAVLRSSTIAMLGNNPKSFENLNAIISTIPNVTDTIYMHIYKLSVVAFARHANPFCTVCCFLQFDAFNVVVYCVSCAFPLFFSFLSCICWINLGNLDLALCANEILFFMCIIVFIFSYKVLD